MIPARPVPKPLELAALVVHPDHVPALDWWETSQGCMAWVPARGRRCGKTAPGYLCQTHEHVAHRRYRRQSTTTEGTP